MTKNRNLCGYISKSILENNQAEELIKYYDNRTHQKPSLSLKHKYKTKFIIFQTSKPLVQIVSLTSQSKKIILIELKNIFNYVIQLEYFHNLGNTQQ